MASIVFDAGSIESYHQFLAVKRLPTYLIRGRTAEFPDEYAELVGVATAKARDVDYDPSAFLFDYQRDISRMALQKRKYAVFADCGLGKTFIMLEFARGAILTG